MKIEYSKWDGRKHWHFEVLPLAEDEYGTWFGAPPGWPVQRQGALDVLRNAPASTTSAPSTGGHAVTQSDRGNYLSARRTAALLSDRRDLTPSIASAPAGSDCEGGHTSGS